MKRVYRSTASAGIFLVCLINTSFRHIEGTIKATAPTPPTAADWLDEIKHDGPQAAEGKLCPEDWTLMPFSGPQIGDVAESGSAQGSYYTWVDQQNTSGIGNNVPLGTGNTNESLMALVDGK
jgi:hypothetical protein